MSGFCLKLYDLYPKKWKNHFPYNFLITRWCKSIGERIWTGLLTKQVNDLFRTGSITAHRPTQRLSQGRVDYVNLAMNTKKLVSAAAKFAQDAGCVALVNHQHCIILLAQCFDLT